MQPHSPISHFVIPFYKWFVIMVSLENSFAEDRANVFTYDVHSTVAENLQGKVEPTNSAKTSTCDLTYRKKKRTCDYPSCVMISNL